MPTEMIGDNRMKTFPQKMRLDIGRLTGTVVLVNCFQSIRWGATGIDGNLNTTTGRVSLIAEVGRPWTYFESLSLAFGLTLNGCKF